MDTIRYEFGFKRRENFDYYTRPAGPSPAPNSIENGEEKLLSKIARRQFMQLSAVAAAGLVAVFLITKRFKVGHAAEAG